MSSHHRRVQERLVALDVINPDPVRGFHSTQARHGLRAERRCRFGPRKRRSRRSSTRCTVDGSAQNRPSHDPRWASLRWDRSMSPHSLNTATISSCSSGVSPWTGLTPGAASSRPPPSATRRRHRSSRRWDNSSKRHAARVLHPPASARTTRSMSAVLVTASTRRGTRPLSPKALFPPPASTAPPSRPTLCADARSRPGPPARHLAACPAGPDATARAHQAPCRATSRSFAIVDRSTRARSAASPTVVSPRTSCTQISYFSRGARNRFLFMPGWALNRTPQCSVENPPMLAETNRNQRHEVSPNAAPVARRSKASTAASVRAGTGVRARAKRQPGVGVRAGAEGGYCVLASECAARYYRRGQGAHGRHDAPGLRTGNFVSPATTEPPLSPNSSGCPSEKAGELDDHRSREPDSNRSPRRLHDL